MVQQEMLEKGTGIVKQHSKRSFFFYHDQIIFRLNDDDDDNRQHLYLREKQCCNLASRSELKDCKKYVLSKE